MTPHTHFLLKQQRLAVSGETWDRGPHNGPPGSVTVPQGGAEGPPELPGRLGLSSEKLGDEAGHCNLHELPFIPQRTLSQTKATGQEQGPVANFCPQKALPGIQASGGHPSSATALPPGWEPQLPQRARRGGGS